MSRLKRVRYGEVFLPSKLKKGQWMELGTKDVDVLYQMAQLTPKVPEPLSPKAKEKLERLSKKSGKRANRRIKEFVDGEDILNVVNN